MTEYATGGMVKCPNHEIKFYNEYAIPSEFARARAVDMLKKINEGLDKPAEDGVE